MALPVVCLVAASCSKPKAALPASDPNRPAVVRLPPPILPGDTAKKLIEPAVSAEEAIRTLAVDYAVLSAAMVFGDQRMVAQSYAQDAIVETPDSTYRGATTIASRFGGHGPEQSLKDFRRISLVTKVVDSLVSDSGTYVIITKRSGADSLFERGRYAATWRIHPSPMVWVMTRDHLYPDAKYLRRPKRK